MGKRILLLYLLMFCIDTAAVCGAVTTLNYPGAANTVAEDVYKGTAVGYYWDAFPFQHGFIYDGSTYTTLDYPCSTATNILGIDGTRIVGAYRDASLNQHGFVCDGSTFQTLDAPGTINSVNGTGALGISGATIVGFYNSDRTHGFVYDGSSFATLDYPGGQQHDAVLDAHGNQLVGTTRLEGKTYGYVYGGAGFTLIDHPEAGSLGTYATGVFGSHIVGYYYDAAAISHGFRYRGGQFRTFDVSSALGRFTQFTGIDGNTAVGFYIDASGNHHGFMTIIPEPTTLVLAIAMLTFLGVRLH
jgi:hypothetical protein